MIVHYSAQVNHANKKHFKMATLEFHLNYDLNSDLILHAKL